MTTTTNGVGVPDIIHHAKPRTGQLDGAKARVARGKAAWAVTRLLAAGKGLIVAIPAATVATLVAEQIYHPLYAIVGGASIVAMSLRTAMTLDKEARIRDGSVIQAAIAAVEPVIALLDRKSPELVNYVRLTRDRPPAREIQFRSCLAQLAMIDQERDEALSTCTNNKERGAVDAATRNAALRVLSFLQDQGVREEQRSASLDISSFSNRLELIADGDLVLPAGKRTGHIEVDRLIDLAEGALRDDPELADSGGARIAPLAREHLPDLVRIYRRATARATPEQRAKAAESLKHGIAASATSIYEALASHQKRRTEEFENQVRFLDARQSGDVS